MSLEAEIRSAVLASLREGLAELRAEVGRPRMIPIKSAPVAYRQLLEAERKAQLVILRIGHASFVDESELYAWIKKYGTDKPKVAQPASDEIGELLDINAQRRGKRGGRAA